MTGTNAEEEERRSIKGLVVCGPSCAALQRTLMYIFARSWREKACVRMCKVATQVAVISHDD